MKYPLLFISFVYALLFSLFFSLSLSSFFLFLHAHTYWCKVIQNASVSQEIHAPTLTHYLLTHYVFLHHSMRLDYLFWCKGWCTVWNSWSFLTRGQAGH